MSSVDRKSTLLQYLTSHLTHFTRALVLAKYSSLSPQIQSLQNIIGFLQLNDTYFESTHRLLFETAQLLQNARARNYDIPNAIDILTKGNYLRLPKIIKNSFCEQDKISKEEQKETIEKLNDIILRKILMEEVVPVEMLKCWKVASGTITFIVENEFKVTLTIDGASSQSCWRILDLKILAANTKASESNLAPYQIGHLIHIAQQQLIPPQTTSSEQQINKPPSPSSTSPVSRHPLLSLYQTLHSFSLSLQHELLYLQAVALARLRWKGLLKVDINRNENIFRVGYWGQNHWITIKLHDSDRIIEVSSFTPSAQTLHQTHPTSIANQQANLPSPQKISFKSRQSDLILSVSAFPSDKSSTSVHIPLPDTQSLDVDLKSVNYDMEAFLNRVLGSHAIHVLMRMVESVNASLASNTRKSGNFGDDKFSLPVFKRFGLDDVVIDFEQSTLTKNPVPPTLRLRCRSNMYLSISVDIRSGKLTVTEETESTDSNRRTNPSAPHPHIRFVEEVINVDSSKLVSAVNALNCLVPSNSRVNLYCLLTSTDDHLV
ncbi:mediator complex subunit MED14-domain-containing protein [Paraphysoderma sedebokerense]|nr:mediator complex subunit MED14-domain-containing protein [Paraphysoderma sedebokerense]